MQLPQSPLGGRYKLVKAIGHGGFATVYEALDTSLGKKVAIKILSPRFASRSEFRKRFAQEARAAAQLRHHLLVDVTDVGETDDHLPYFVMEYLEGSSLGDRIRELPSGMPWKHVVAIVAEVVKALEIAHQQGIVHRDVKPGNVFLKGGVEYGPDLRVKLLDLGIAKIHSDAPDDDMPETRESQGTPGTPEYMAPEQIHSGAKGPSIDIYAVGVLMYRLLTGTLPFTSKSSWEVLRMHVEDPPMPPSQRTPAAEIPPKVESLVLRLMEKDPLDRPASATAVRMELELLSQAAAPSAPQPAASAHRNERLLRAFSNIMRLSIAAVTILLLTLFIRLGDPAAQAQPSAYFDATYDSPLPEPTPSSAVEEPASLPEPEEDVLLIDDDDDDDDNPDEANGSPEELDELTSEIESMRPQRPTHTAQPGSASAKDPSAAVSAELKRVSLEHCATGLPSAITLAITANLDTHSVTAKIRGTSKTKARCVADALEKTRLKTRGQGSVKLNHRVEL